MKAQRALMKSLFNCIASTSWHKTSRLNSLIILLPNSRNQMVTDFSSLVLKLESLPVLWNLTALKSTLFLSQNTFLFCKLCLLSSKLSNIVSIHKAILVSSITSLKGLILIASTQWLKFPNSESMFRKIYTMILYYCKMLLSTPISTFWNSWWD